MRFTVFYINFINYINSYKFYGKAKKIQKRYNTDSLEPIIKKYVMGFTVFKDI
jgi:hypothetical protein